MIKIILFSLLGNKWKNESTLFNIVKSYMILYMLILPGGKMIGQTFEWIKPFPLDYSYNYEMLDYGVSVDQYGNPVWGGIFMFHEFYGINTYGDLNFVKMDQEGNTVSAFHCYGDGRIISLKHDNDNNLLALIGVRSDLLLDSSDTLYLAGQYETYYLIKLSDDFDLLWSKQMAGGMDYNGAGCFQIDSNNTIYLGTDNFNNSELHIIDPDGNEIGQILQENVNLISSIAIDNEGNIYTAGSCPQSGATYGGVVYEPPFIYNLYIAKYNNQLQVQWVNYAEDITCTFPQVEANDPDYVYFSGHLFDETHFGSITVNGPDWVYDFFVTRLNSQGEFVWAKEVPNMTTLSGDASIGKFDYSAVDQEQNIYLTGFIRGDINWGNGINSMSTNIGPDVLLLKYNSDGELTIAKTGGGESYDKGISMSLGNNGDVYMACIGFDDVQFDSVSASLGGLSPYLVKLNNVEFTSVSGLIIKTSTLNIYPNPAADILNISFNGSVTEIIQIQIHDITGSLVRIMDVYANRHVQLNIANLKGGVYFLSTYECGTLKANQKIIKL
ncbi:MAG: T9SS type A sorting domain-containing protein [Bacteroidales bacterium]|nr:T9SS type A sorting domain-containing protein [Bacteroidales bacterium]